MNADEAIKMLKEGNERFVKNIRKNRDFDKRRAELLAGQKPFVTILGCSDSRIVANFIFDTDMGELFLVKNAGNIANDAITLGSLEYGVCHLHTPVLLVLGHEGCGAVNATCKCRGQSEEGNIKEIVNAIAPIAKKDNFEVDRCIRDSLVETARLIPQKSKIIGELVKEGKARVMGAYYSMTTGKVEFL